MPIVDQANNALVVPATAQMLGFTEPAVESEVLNLRMYDFLVEPIRKADTTEGRLFVKRFLEGPQQIWQQIQSDIFRLKDLWDVFRIPDELLQYMKWIVGWVRDTDRITDKLTETQLRKLIASSMPLWKRRGTEEAFKEAISIIYATRMRMWNWFDLRWILDESILGENHQGRDISILGSVDQRVSNLRVMDQEGMDHELIADLVKLFRGSGERVLITYLHFLDQFDQNDAQWPAPESSTPISINELNVLHSNDVVALDFNAGSDRADWANTTDITGQPRTIIMRFRSDVAGTPRRLLTINDSGLDLEAAFVYANAANEIGYGEAWSGTFRRAEGFDTAGGTTNWHWIAIVADGTALASGIRIYVDQVQEVASYPVADDGVGTPADVNGTISLGGRTEDNVDNIDGMIADVRIWNAELTEDELRLEFLSVGAPVRSADLFFNPDFATLIDGVSEITGTLNSGATQEADQAPSAEVFIPDVDGSAWGDCIVYARVRGTQLTTNGEFGLVFHATDVDNYVRVGIDIDSNELQIQEWVTGSQNILATGVTPFPLAEDTWYGLRVEVVEGTVYAYLENNLVITYDSGLTLTAGAPGLFHSQHATFECSELEQFPLPVVDEYIDINS